MTLKNRIKRAAAMRAYSYVDKSPEENIPKLLDKLVREDKKGESVASQAASIKREFTQDGNNWRELILSLWRDIDAGERRRLFESAAVNGSLIGSSVQKKNKKSMTATSPGQSLWIPPPPAISNAQAAGRRSMGTE